MTVVLEELDVAAIFLKTVLIKLKELDGSGERYTIMAGNAITMSKLAATYWLAHRACACRRPLRVVVVLDVSPSPSRLFFSSFLSFLSQFFFLYYHEFRCHQFRLRSRAAYDFNERPIDRIKDTASRPYILNDQTVPRHLATDQGLVRQTIGSVKYL